MRILNLNKIAKDFYKNTSMRENFEFQKKISKNIKLDLQILLINSFKHKNWVFQEFSKGQ